jgi:pimeloyl-ACP methyl ester carboxylesterase
VHHQYRGPDKAAFTIIYSHGNAEDLGINYMDLADKCRQFKCDVFAYEYPGYGASDENSDATEQGCYEGADAAWEYVTEVLNVPPRNVILFGRSLGTGPTVDLAMRHSEACGVILQSPLTSGIRTKCCDCVALSLCCIDVFKSVDKAALLQMPTLIMHGTEDNVVPCENGRRLHSRLTDPFEPLWVIGAGHNDMEYVGGDAMYRRIMSFLEFCEKRRKMRAEQETSSGSASAGYEGKSLPVI